MICKLLLALFLILAIMVSYKNNCDVNYLTVLTIFTLIIVYQLIIYQENFNPDDKNFLSIKGPSTLYNIQKNQDKDIELLEKQLKLVKHVYKEKLDEMDQKQNNYKIIKIDRSCPILNPKQSGDNENMAKNIYFNQDNTFGDLGLTGKESINLSSKLNSDIFNKI